VAARRTYKRDKRGRFASTGSSRVKRVGRKISRRHPRYVHGSLGMTVQVPQQPFERCRGRMGPASFP
jgi:hypothetical protein